MIQNILGSDADAISFFTSRQSVQVMSKYEADFAETVWEARNTAEIDAKLVQLSHNILADAGLAETAERFTAANYAFCRQAAEMRILTADHGS